MSLPNDNIPRFAVVGRVNKGKSSILATLAEEVDNEKIRISSIPGETTMVSSIPLKLQGEMLIEFLDTPGFHRARQALDWMQKRHRKKGDLAKIDTVREFVEAHKGKRKYEDECLLLEPVLEGAGILYVVDASKPFREDFLAEMEILRWTGRPRMALINNISEETDFGDEWRQHLGEYFNLTRSFNAHQARFRERIRLLKSLLEIEDTRRANIEKTVRILEREWDQRRSRTADVILDLIEKSLKYRASKQLSPEESQRDYQKEEIAEGLKDQYIKKIEDIEREFHRKMVNIYKHGEVESMDDGSFAAMADELFSEEVWEVFGLNRWQLSAAAGLAGAASGSAVDAASGGHTIGLGTFIGGAIGVATSLLRGKKLADIKITNPTSPLGAEMAAGGISIKAGPPKNPNFPWILLDRAFFHFEQMIARAHGRRDKFVIDFAKLSKEGEQIGRSASLSGSARRNLQKWFSDLTKGKQVYETQPVFEIISEVLEKIEDEQSQGV